MKESILRPDAATGTTTAKEITFREFNEIVNTKFQEHMDATFNEWMKMKNSK